MAKHKVTTDPSTAYTGTIVDIEAVDGQYGAQYKITFEDGTELYEKTDAVERQLARLSIGVADVLGETLRFSRTPMKNDPSKGFLNIDKARAAAGAPAKRASAPAKAAHAAGPLIAELDDFDIVEELRDVPYPSPARNETAPLHASAVGVETRAALASKAAIAQAHYAAHFAWYVKTVLPQLNELQIPVDAGNINAAVATLMIEEAKR